MVETQTRTEPIRPAADVLVQASNLTKVFGRGAAAVTAVAEATFRIGPAQRIAITGPSGSGKSTLLHLIAALDRPTSGTIDWPALGPRDRLRPGPVSFAFQGPSLLPPLSVLENVALPMLLAGATESDATAAALELIEQLDLGAVTDKLPEELSGGQSQRAGVARALVGTPRLILADEPTGQQDRVSGQHVLDVMLASVDASGATLVVATHDRTIAERLSQRWSMRDRRLETGVVLRSA
jgi:putative ABC transport system ATP-binding protein/lipoprotein-releasing system ATP-binding protein